MANNPYVNKVEYAGQTVMDITDTTAEASGVESGKVFYAANGQRKVGTGMLNYIDDTAGSGDTNKTWSADKLVQKIGSVGNTDLQTQITQLNTNLSKLKYAEKRATIAANGDTSIDFQLPVSSERVLLTCNLGVYPLPYMVNQTYIKSFSTYGVLTIHNDTSEWTNYRVKILYYDP